LEGFVFRLGGVGIGVGKLKKKGAEGNNMGLFWGPQGQDGGVGATDGTQWGEKKNVEKRGRSSVAYQTEARGPYLKKRTKNGGGKQRSKKPRRGKMGKFHGGQSPQNQNLGGGSISRKKASKSIAFSEGLSVVMKWVLS